jgi:hypothetical protein
MRSDQIIARILLSVLALSAMALGIIFFVEGAAVYGLILFLPALGFLVWIWIPRREPGSRP